MYGWGRYGGGAGDGGDAGGVLRIHVVLRRWNTCLVAVKYAKKALVQNEDAVNSDTHCY